MSSGKFRLIEYASIGILAYLHHVNAKQGTGYSWKELFTPDPNVSILVQPPTGVMLIVMALTLVGCWTIFKTEGPHYKISPISDHVQHIRKELALITKEHIKFYLIMLFIVLVVVIIGHLIIKQLVFDSWERNMAGPPTG